MPTYCALHVRTTDVEGVVEELREWLGATHGGSIEVRRGEADPAADGRGFSLSADQPTCFAVAPHGEGWVVARFNCFSDLAVLAARMSARFSAHAVVVNAQSTSDAHLLAVFERGRARRVLEYGDGLTRNEGEPFPFEGEIFGIDDDELPPAEEWAFFADELEAMCARLGLGVLEHPTAPDEPESWTVLRMTTPARPTWLSRLLGLAR